MRLWFAILISLGLGAPLWAQTSQVLGGEHGDFTRLTFSLAGPDWELTRSETGYDLSFSAGNGFDLARAFDRIQRGRIAGLRPEGDLLHIDLACECWADPFVWNGTHLVVDIKPGSDPNAPDPAVAQAPAALPAFPDISRPAAGGQRTGASDQLERALSSVAPTETAGLEGDIARSIARAATQGLLEPSSRGLAEVAPPSIPAIQAVAQPANHAATTPLAPVEDMPAVSEQGTDEDTLSASYGITFQTSIDRDSPGLGSAEVPIQSEPGCLQEQLFDMETWIDDRPFADQIGERRLTLTSELDRVPPGAAVDLAKAYIAFGFGREAILALAIDGTSSQERRVLASIAAALDEIPMPYPELGTQGHCSSPAALWAMLAHPVEETIRPGDLGAVLRAFQRLPAPLQGLVGPRLAERLVALNDPESADAVLNRLAPTSADVSNIEGEQAEAAIVGHQVGPDAEIAALSAIARDNIRMTPEALVNLLTLARTEGTPIGEDMIELSAAFRFEYRTAPILPELVRAEAQLLSDLGRYEDAFALLNEEQPHLDPALLAELDSDTVKAMTEKGEDLAFLNMALVNMPDAITPEAQNLVAARLIKMQFPDRAMSLLLGPSSGSAAAERRYLKAEAALQIGKPEDALRYIGGFTDQRAALIRAAALQASDDYAAAYAATTQVSGAVTEPEAAWRAGAWADIARAEDPVLQFAGTAMLGSESATAANAEDPATIAIGQSALESAQRSRDMIGALLDRYQVPDS